MRLLVCWYVTLYSGVDGYQCYMGTCCASVSCVMLKAPGPSKISEKYPMYYMQSPPTIICTSQQHKILNSGVWQIRCRMGPKGTFTYLVIGKPKKSYTYPKLYEYPSKSQMDVWITISSAFWPKGCIFLTNVIQVYTCENSSASLEVCKNITIVLAV